MILSGFIPEVGAGVNINHGLAKYFIKYGHEVDIITSYPRKYKLSNNDVEIPTNEIIDNIHVYRVKHFYTRDSKVLRGLEHFYSPIYYYIKYRDLLKKHGDKYDVVFTHIPPLAMYYLAKAIERRSSIPVIINIPDFHPDALVESGFLRNRIIISILSFIEKRTYKSATYLTVQAPGGIDYVVKKGAKRESVECIYNSVDQTEIEEVLSYTPGATNNNQKVRITYAGIFSIFQNIDAILDVAKMLEKSNVLFQLVGNGTEYNRISNRIASENIENVSIRPYVPREEYIKLINESDVGIVSLDNRMKTPFIPGKVINLMAIGKPIFALVPKGSETERLINEAGCGISVAPDNKNEVLRKLNEMLEMPNLKEMGLAGRKFYEENLTTEIASKRYETLMLKLIDDYKSRDK